MYRRQSAVIVTADVMNYPRDAERPGEAQQVGYEAEGDAEHQRPAERLTQSQPDPPRALRRDRTVLLHRTLSDSVNIFHYNHL